MILTAHQPDLFPHTGFWHKMWKADLFDVAIYDQFQTRGYQRRVKMRGSWASVPVEHPKIGMPIIDVRLTDGAKQVLSDTIFGRYRDARYWGERGEMVLDWIWAAPSESLWAFNTDLIVQVRDWLDIDTPIAFGKVPYGPTSTDRLLGLCRQYGADTYLSGLGARAYLDMGLWARRLGPGLMWSAHEARHGESILTSIFDLQHPMEDVTRMVSA